MIVLNDLRNYTGQPVQLFRYDTLGTQTGIYIPADGGEPVSGYFRQVAQLPVHGNATVVESSFGVGFVDMPNDTFPILRVSNGNLRGLPRPQQPEWYIVTRDVAAAVKEARERMIADLLLLGGPIRDPLGNTIGYTRFEIV